MSEVSSNIRPISYEELEAEEFDFNYPFQYQLVGGERGTMLGCPGVGVLFMGQVHGEENDISYLYVAPQWRGQGWSRRLLDAALAYSKAQGRTCWMTVYFNSDYAKLFLRRYACEKGMKTGIRCVISQVVLPPLREHVPDGVRRFMDRMEVCRALWERRGAVTCTYDQMPPAVRQRLREEWEEIDPEKRQISWDIPPLTENLDETLSVVSYLGDEPLAYVTIERRGDAAVLTGHVCLRRYRKTGATFLPVLHFFHLMEHDTSVNQVTYKILEQNRLEYMQSERDFVHLRPKITEMRSFCYEVAEKPENIESHE